MLLHVRAVALVVIGVVGLTASDVVDNTSTTSISSVSLGFSSNLPSRFSTDTTLDVGVFGMQTFQDHNGSAIVTAISIVCSVDGKSLACPRNNQFEFRLRVADLTVRQHTLEITPDPLDKVQNNGGKLQHTWVVVSANPNVSIRNQPSDVLGGIANYDEPWEAHIGLDTAATGLLCRLSNASFDSWLQCCDSVFTTPECTSGCRSGLSPITCESRDAEFESCAANKSVFELGTVLAESSWLPCTSPVAVVSLALFDGGTNNNEHGQNESADGIAVLESESLLPSSQRYLFQVKAQGLDGGVGGNVASWEWGVLPPRLYNATTPYTNTTQLNMGFCATTAHVGLTSFAVLSWMLIAVVALIAYLKRETLRAGWGPTKARMAKLEHSQRKLEVTTPKPMKFSAGKTTTSNQSDEPIAPPRRKKSTTTASAKKLFTITMSDQANELLTVSPEPHPGLTATINPTIPTTTVITNATIPLHSLSTTLTPTAPTRYKRGKLKSVKTVLAGVEDEPPSFAPPPTPSPSPSPPPSPPAASPNEVFSVVKRKFPPYVNNTRATLESDQNDAPTLTPFQIVKYKR